MGDFWLYLDDFGRFLHILQILTIRSWKLTVVLNNHSITYCNMGTTARKWTFDEVKGFSEWDQSRKEGKLGVPVKFDTVEKLESWLNAKN